MELTTRRAPISRNSFDPQARTFEATIATTTPVQRGDFAEVLDLSGPLPAALPLLNGHRQGTAGDVIGRVEKVRREGAALVASIRLSGRDDVRGIAQDIADGILTDISVGYRIADAKTTEQGGTRTVTVVPEILEASIVPIGADRTAKIRGEEARSMKKKIVVEDDGEIEIRADEGATRTARAASRRCIEALADEAGLDQAFVDEALERGLTERQARAEAFEALKARSAATATIRNTRHNSVSFDNPAARRDAIADALSSRALGAEPSEAGRSILGEGVRSIADAARYALEATGERTMGRSAAQIIERAYNTVSDFPELLAGVGNRTLAARFGEVVSPLAKLARRKTAQDFRSFSELRLANDLRLDPLGEHGELKAGSFVEGKESMRIGSYGRTFALSFNALANDDLGAFSQVTSDLATAAANTVNDLVVGLVTSNPKLSDGKGIFHPDHANLSTGAASALGEDALETVVLRMRRQTGIAGERIAVNPKVLAIPPELEVAARRLLASINPTTTADVNPWASAFDLLIEPRLSDAKAWYLIDPALGDLVDAYLSGYDGPQVESRPGWNTLGTEWRVHMHYGAAFLGWRGWAKSAGQ